MNPDTDLRDVIPAYGTASLSELLPAVLCCLGVPDTADALDLRSRLDGVRRVAVLLVDGLGADAIPEASRSSPVLASAAAGELGRLDGLTATFPSSTPISLASLCTGAPPGQHGVLGFNTRIPGGDTILNHIHWRDQADPLRWQPLETCFARAHAAGIATTVVDRVEHRDPGLREAIYRGGAIEQADGHEEMVSRMLEAVRRGDRALTYGYYADVDNAGHVHGPGSPQWHEAVERLDGMLRRLVDELPDDAALLVTSDHGMIDVPVESRFDITAHPRLREGVRLIAGEPRVRYVHTVEGAASDVRDRWAETLGARARVLTRDEAVALGLFGPVAPDHLPRLGDVVVIGRDRHVVLGVTECDPPQLARNRGHHGGATVAELSVPLWTYRALS